MRVLCVDDDVSCINLLDKTLQNQGFEVETANSGRSAIELLHRHRFDALILDIMMPGIDGFQVGRSMRTEQLNENTPIIFLTAHPLTLRESDARRLQPVAIVTKPFRRESLLRTLKRLGADDSQAHPLPVIPQFAYRPASVLLKDCQTQGKCLASESGIVVSKGMQGLSALCVDDDPAILRLLQKLLEVEGMRVTTVNTGREAMERLKHEGFDLMILDIMMPGINGFQVGRAARFESPNIEVPIMFITAHPFSLKEDDAKWLRPVATIVKPFRRQRLLQTIQSLIEERKVVPEVISPMAKVDPSPNGSAAITDNLSMGLLHLN